MHQALPRPPCTNPPVPGHHPSSPDTMATTYRELSAVITPLPEWPLQRSILSELYMPLLPTFSRSVDEYW